jgi:DNA-directed RNA polymerase I, II, and III subunit RPABC1
MENYSRNRIFYKVRKTTLEMLQDRDFQVSDEDLQLPFNEFVTRLNEGEIDIEAKSKDSDALTYVYFYLDSKNYGKKNLENLKEEVNKKYGDKEINVIIVLEDKPTAQLNKEINTEDYSNFEIFLVKNLMINITKHVNVPRHEIIKDKEEIDKIVGEYQCTRTQLPRYMTTDPVVKYYGLKPGHLCRIFRNNPMTGEEIYYRMVR